MATRSTSFNELVGFESVSFIRAQQIQFNATDMKPSTRYYVFFDGQPVSGNCLQTGNALGAPIVSDTAGNITGTFFLPGQTFNTGRRVLRLSDNPNIDSAIIPGSAVSSAAAEFTATGFRTTFQRTVEEVTEVVRQRTLEVFAPPVVIQAPPAAMPAPPAAMPAPPDAMPEEFVQRIEPPRGGDPLAQTFFTYGVRGGCFITGVELYFQSKDATLPVKMDLREVSNGYPTKDKISIHSSVTLEPQYVNISDNGMVPTLFEFSRPIYIEEDKDYCFVVDANSSAYNVWTAELGKKSIESGKIIFEQPYVGSLFKSENNSTWSAEQTQDIKFCIYKAKFDITSERTLQQRVIAPDSIVQGKYLSVVSGSPVVTVKLPIQHGFRTGDKVVLNGLVDGNYRGITNVAISNPAGFAVVDVDDYTFQFNLGSGNNATSTGTLETNGKLKAVYIDSPGSNYSNPTAQIVGGGGTGATIVLVTAGGKIVGADITNAGSGYTSTPSIIIADSIGSPGMGADLSCNVDANFSIAVNRRYQAVTPLVSTFSPNGTELLMTIRGADEKTYSIGEHIQLPLDKVTSMGNDNVLVSSINETTFFGSEPSLDVITRFSSRNENVSPVIDMLANPRLRLEHSIVNDILTNAATITSPLSELAPKGGLAYSRYIGKPVTLQTISKGARIIVAAASIATTSFNVYFRASLANSVTPHADVPYIMMECEVDRNKSSDLSRVLDYEFSIEDLPDFDTYNIKIVLSSDNKYQFPIIHNYRTVILST